MDTPLQAPANSVSRTRRQRHSARGLLRSELSRCQLLLHEPHALVPHRRHDTVTFRGSC